MIYDEIIYQNHPEQLVSGQEIAKNYQTSQK
jgi:hypothetical protein